VQAAITSNSIPHALQKVSGMQIIPAGRLIFIAEIYPVGAPDL
jgi:hypothetical protein